MLVAPGPMELVQASVRRRLAIFEAGRRVHHCLLVAREVAGEAVLRLEQGLSDAGDVPVAEDAEDTAEERLFDAVEAGELLGQELDDRLSHGQAPSGGHDDGSPFSQQ
jgi:hypothetical protein